jgi:hypothetical protein
MKVLQISKCDLIQIRSFYKFQAIFKAKTEKKRKKEKGKRNRKAERATGKQTGPAREGAHGPLTALPESLPHPLSPATDGRGPLVIPSEGTKTNTARTWA